MKVRLLHPDRPFDAGRAPPPGSDTLTRDLELDAVLDAMAGDDPLVREVARAALLVAAYTAPDVARYRQAMLRDALAYPDTVRALYDLAGEAAARRRKEWLGVFSRSPSGILAEAAALMRMYLGLLGRLRSIVQGAPGELASPAWKALAATVREELDDGFFEAAERTLADLRRGRPVVLSAGLGEGNAGEGYVMGRGAARRPAWLAWMLRRGPSTFHVAPFDDGSSRVLADMRNAAIAPVARMLAAAAEGARGSFEALRTELAFYVGCSNLHERLRARAAPLSFPTLDPRGSRRWRFRGLIDPGLALRTVGAVVGNDLELDGKDLVVVTGANQGGKTVFLRSLGLAQLMAQAGMFVTAEAFEGEACRGLFTHYRREEDAAMQSGELDEELARLSAIVDGLQPHATLLLNESFAATNEREGSEVARQVVEALVRRGVRVAFVTHLYAFARGAHARSGARAAFLRAGRRPDGSRSFRMSEGEPLETSYGRDLYREILAEVVEVP